MHRQRIQIDNRIEEIARVASEVEAFGAESGLPRSVVDDLSVALDEVISNAIAYGYSDSRDHRIAIGLSFDGKAVTAEISDDGAPFDPLKVPPPTLQGNIEERQIGGLGIHFVRSLMDACDYARKDGRNILTLTKRVV